MQKDRWWKEKPFSWYNHSKQEDFVFDSALRAENIAKTGCDATNISCIGGHLNDRKIYFKSSLAKRTNKDQLGEYVPELHKRGIKAIVYFNVHAVEPEFAEDHPDWRQITEDGKFKRGVYHVDTSFCVNSPWREWVFQALRDLLKYDIDGVFYDGPNFWPDCCYCKHCQREFRELYGMEIPRKSDRKNPNWRKLVEFQTDSIAKFLEDSNRVIKEINPNVIFFRNIGNAMSPKWVLAVNAWKVIEHTDMLGAEGGFRYGDFAQYPLWKAGAMAKLLETQSGGKPYMVFSVMIHKPWGYVMLPNPETKLLYAETIANGANTWFGFRYGFEPEVQPEVDVIAELNQFLKKNASYYHGAESAARVALLWSVQTINFHPSVEISEEDFTRRMKEEAVGNPTKAGFGFYEMLFRSHVPFDLIDEPVLGKRKMDKYDLLILPNSTCLSGEDVDNVRRYVKRGGNIIATFETSLCNHYGEKQDDLQLSDVFGATSENQGIGPLNFDYINPVSPDHPFFEGMKRWLPAPKYGIKITLTNGKRLVDFCEKQPGTSGSQRFPTLPESPDPAMVVNKYGKGTCVYFAGTFGEDYWNYKHPYYKLLVENCVKQMSKKVVTLKGAPSSLEIVVRRQTNPSRWIVHLINFTGEMIRPIERVIPLRNLKISLKNPGKVSLVETLWSKEELQYELSGEWISFTVPRIEEYEVVVIS